MKQKELTKTLVSILCEELFIFLSLSILSIQGEVEMFSKTRQLTLIKCAGSC